jgi:general secretion pathway protein F
MSMSQVDYNLMTEEPVPASQVGENKQECNYSLSITANNNRSKTNEAIYRRYIFKRTSTKEISRIARQLATLLHAGMPLVPALSALVEQLQQVSEKKASRLFNRENPLTEIMKEVRDNVSAGSSLSAALAKHPDVFSNVFVNMVAAGETSGTLEEVFLRLAQMLEKRVHLTGKVKSVLAYPLMMAVVATAVVIFLLSFVVPSITQIFLEMNRQLPLTTRMLISTSAFMKTYFVGIVIMICAALFGFGAWVRTENGKMAWDRSKLKLPIFGTLVLKLETARLTRTLGILLSSGVPILHALETVKGLVQNRFIADALDVVKNKVGRGDDIADAIRKSELFPPIVTHIIATGQMSGNIEEGLIDIADMYDNEVEMTTKTLTSLLEPAILLIMGAIVGFIVLAILLPIFEINQAF